jgi:hypothetical protein
MKSIFKTTLVILLVFCSQLFVNAQDADKTVTLVVSGSGKTQDEAKQNALRSAIEQAFGTFISSKTEILNDNLVKDEIVSVANGNIQKFDIISEVQIPEGGFATTLNATVSVTKLTSFVESKGVEVEFKGSLLGANLRQQRMNEGAELKSIINICEASTQILSNSLDYSIEIAEPVKSKSKESSISQTDDFEILLTIKLSPNKNYDKFVNYFISNIKAISMPSSEQEAYEKLNKEVYHLSINHNEKYYFRNKATNIALQNLFLKSNQYLHKFSVVSDIDSILVNTCCYYQEKPEISAWNIFNETQRRDIKPKIWNLNCGTSRITSSLNYNSGFPQFWFPETRHNIDNPSWRVYFEYIKGLRNNKILFQESSYYTGDGNFYIEGLENYRGTIGIIPNLPGVIQKTGETGSVYPIGEVDLTKIDYFCQYLAIYSEEDISKISNISVKKIK